MSQDVSRRDFLRRAWKAIAGLLAGAAAWTSWDILRSVPASGLGGVIKTIPPAEVTEIPVYVRAAQAYLTRIDDQVVGLWQRCPHLGCRVNWCESSREFECACHGSRFNRAGEVRSGPAPRGMDRFTISAEGDLVEVDTSDIVEGAPPGEESIDEPPAGPACSETV